MIARHSHEQSNGGEGVEFVESKECEDETHGVGLYTEKRIHLSRFVSHKLWLQFMTDLDTFLATLCRDFGPVNF